MRFPKSPDHLSEKMRLPEEGFDDLQGRAMEGLRTHPLGVAGNPLFQQVRIGIYFLIEREEVVDEQKKDVKLDDMEIVFDALVKKHGKKRVLDTFARLSKR